MDFEEAWGATISRARARAEVARHQVDFADFLAEVGDRATYKGSEVLSWLGY